VRFSGAVLAGGRSRRFGRDKALEPVDGVAMAARVAATLRAAGATNVVAVGGDRTRLGEMGLQLRADSHPGEGPLGGLVDALAGSTAPVTVVVACDVPWIDAPTIAALVGTLGSEAVDVAFAHADGHREPLVAAWRTAAAHRVLAAAFEAGERAVHRASGPLRAVDVPVDRRAVHNVNHPEDLHR
jgi:molybdopterin-guanine dinucleotide biosynthesis protein A